MNEYEEQKEKLLDQLELAETSKEILVIVQSYVDLKKAKRRSDGQGRKNEEQT